MAGATAGAASTLAGSETSDACPKCAAISGAVPTVAAPVSAVASASARGSPRRGSPSRTRPASTRMATTAAKLSCQPTSSIARGLSASVTAVGQQQRVPARRGPARQHGDDAGGSHHPRPLDRRPAAGEGHVERDRREDEREPHAQAEAERRPRRPARGRPAA